VTLTNSTDVTISVCTLVPMWIYATAIMVSHVIAGIMRGALLYSSVGAGQYTVRSEGLQGGYINTSVPAKSRCVLTHVHDNRPRALPPNRGAADPCPTRTRHPCEIYAVT
jgi:hypothetical protein